MRPLWLGQTRTGGGGVPISQADLVPSTIKNLVASRGVVTVDGCGLARPPAAIKIPGVNIVVNLNTWQDAARNNRALPVWKVSLGADGSQYVLNRIKVLSGRRFAVVMMAARGIVPDPTWHSDAEGFTALYEITKATATTPGAAFGWGWSWDGWLQNGFEQLKAGKIPVWIAMAKGEVPIAEIEPPFPDDGDKWGLYVRLYSGYPNFNAEVTLRRMPRSWTGQLANWAGDVWEKIVAGLEWICDKITSEKLQEVANYAVAYPSGPVQGTVLAWQGVAQICKKQFPPPSGPPDCAATSDPVVIPEPPVVPWWQVHKGKLIAGGVAAIGVLGALVYFRSRPAVP